MTKTFGLGLALIAALAAAEPVKLAQPGLTLVDVDPAKGSFLAETLAAAMTSRSVRVVTQKEIASMLGLERQKQLLGCSDESSSCVAELGSALGVDGVLLGDVAHLGKRFQFNLKVLSPKDGAVLSLRTGKAGSEEELVDQLEQAGRELAAEVLARLGRAPEPGEPPASVAVGQPRKNLRLWSLLPGVVGALSVGVAAISFSLAADEAAKLRGGATFSLAEADAIRRNANDLQTSGTLFLVVGAAALVTAAAILVFGGEVPPATPTAFALPGGAGLAVSGVFP